MVRPSLDARQIVWEIFAPLVYIRFVYFQARSTRADVLRGKEAARRHIAHLIESLRAD
jgi:hypothetical protein